MSTSTTRSRSQIDQGKYGEILNYSWSPDSKWIAYDKNAENGYSVVHLYSLADRKITPVTNSMTNSNSPLFDPDGKYLYFLSDRDFNEVLGNVDFEFANPKTTRVYIATLRKDEPSPFSRLSDETQVKKEENPDELLTPPAKEQEKNEGKEARPRPEKTKNEKEPSPEATTKTKTRATKTRKRTKKSRKNSALISTASRAALWRCRSNRAVIGTFWRPRGFIYYSTTPIQGLVRAASRRSAGNPRLRSERAQRQSPDRRRAALCAFLRRLQVALRSRWRARWPHLRHHRRQAGRPKKVGDGALNLTGMQAQVDPPAEWKQMFNEVWRQERDYFFDAAMNGVDWEKMRDKYAQLLPSSPTATA